MSSSTSILVKSIDPIKPWSACNTANITRVEILRYLRPQLTLAEVTSSISSFQVHVDAGLNSTGVSMFHMLI
jgi:hypothetical protein